MADPLKWKEGEGYDIHVLRRGPSSKPLTGTFDLDPQFPLSQFPPVFIPHFKGAPNAQGVKVDTATGEVTATAHPSPTQPKLRNFLLTARQDITGQGITFESMIRIHVHDSINKIWLTPSTLTIHTRADECCFTVLAEFDDGCVGDITGWPQIKWKSSDENSVKVLADGTLSAEPGRPEIEMEIDITATLSLANPATQQSATGKAATSRRWAGLGENAPVQFVDGPLRPIERDLSSAKPESVTSVVKSRVNILFISEGFLPSQEKDFNTAVEFIVKTAFRQDFLQPFKLLKDSINYWSVFVPSREDGISLLGDHEITGTSPKEKGSAVPRPEAPPPGSTQWSLENMIHEVGLPAPKDPVQSIPDWVTYWKKLYDTPVTEKLVASNFSDWNALRSRSPLNERDSVFGIAHGTRARVSDETGGDPLLRASLRRTKEASIEEFINSLNYGIPPPGGDPYNIGGETWAKTQKDQGLVCFLCLSDRGAGEARPGYFAASTGYEKLASLAVPKDGNGKEIKTAALSDPKAPYSSDILSSRVAHECGHALGLGDEYGPANGASLTVASSGIPLYPNLQTKDAITSAGPGSTVVYDPRRIKWLWHRVSKVGVLDGQPDFQGDPDPVQFLVRLRKGDGKPFGKNDLVRIRESPVHRPTSADPYAGILLQVDFPGADAVSVSYKNPGGRHVDLSLFNPAQKYVLVCTSIKTGTEFTLVADPILNNIQTSGGPLNAPLDNPGAACVASKNSAPFMTPTNVPKLKFKKAPPSMADVIGIYEGGGHYDCGVFRPAGRCKMRTAEDSIIPFCHVCRYVIVDRVDPMKLPDLDTKMYNPYYPT